VERRIEAWLSVRDGLRAVSFYVEALGADVLDRLEGDGGSVEVARLSVGGAGFWIAHEPDVRPAGARFILLVDDPDAAYRRAVGAGATEVAPVHEDHGYRTGRVTDPFGHDWEFARPLH
jgi:PhnB protein